MMMKKRGTRIRIYSQPPLYLVKKGKDQAYAWNEDQRKALVENLPAEKKIALTFSDTKVSEK